MPPPKRWWMAGSPFVTGQASVSLALTAKTWGVRPSSLIGVTDPVVALALDEALAVRLYQQAASQPAPGASSYQPAARLPWATYEEPQQSWALSGEEMDRIDAERRRMN
jgi:hypothetical protein